MDYYEDGYKVIGWIQKFHHPLLDAFFSGVSALGVGPFYLIAIPLIYWCFDKQFGARLCFLFLLGIFFNTWVKNFVQTTRPSAERVRIVFPESGGSYSFPSGHAQGSVSFWGYFLIHVRKVWFSVLGLALILAMCVSRLYLGLHFPWDVLGGAAIGLASLIFFFVLLAGYEKIKSKIPWPAWLLAVIISSVTMAWLFPQKRFSFILGCFLGFCSGVVLEERFVGFTIRKVWLVGILKVALGLGIACLIVWTGQMILKGWEMALFGTYAVAGVWVSFGAPWCFKKLGWG